MAPCYNSVDNVLLWILFFRFFDFPNDIYNDFFLFSLHLCRDFVYKYDEANPIVPYSNYLSLQAVTIE